ncbi:PREDICTED: uncharacterized protein LOC105563867 isoform X1 [Vollenhovia emeryi]|uniref:uncharacterized protein LOC105563867 isoform X1 n=1 Tax=Vollenhovia emeryi TaxID=411798 RepID=UPI0005F588B3|nr:PREDICTED: uncharacterized protein LOC105563867 isoform X1 [Vollenhovia emeryi]
MQKHVGLLFTRRFRHPRCGNGLRQLRLRRHPGLDPRPDHCDRRVLRLHGGLREEKRPLRIPVRGFSVFLNVSDTQEKSDLSRKMTAKRRSLRFPVCTKDSFVFF